MYVFNMVCSRTGLRRVGPLAINPMLVKKNACKEEKYRMFLCLFGKIPVEKLGTKKK